MWYTLFASPKMDDDFRSSAAELMESTSRTVFLSVGALFFLCIVATAIWPDQIATNVWLVSPIFVLTFGITLWALPRSYLAAHIVWQVGLAAAITLTVYLFQQPALGFLYVLLPFMAVITVGWPAGLVSETLIGVLSWYLSHGLIAPRSGLAGHSLGIILGGGTCALLGWASARALLTVTSWSLFSFEQARQTMEETREHRAELARVLKDLDQAYYRLERANHMLVRARSEAEEAKEARNRFALAISHELRTPLNFILGFSELMVNSPDTYAPRTHWPPGLYDDAQEIYRSSQHLLRLVNDILDLGQIEALQMTLLKEWTDPLQVAREVKEMVLPAFERKDLWIRIQAADSVPSVFVDRTRIRQVLLNLVSNSLRFTDRGGVTIHLDRVGESVRFCVQDTGTGISEEDQPKVFEAFRQLGNSTWRRREGAGLGIPISRRFIELHGGEIWIESELGQGTSFFFTLPLPEAAHEQPPVSAEGSAQDTRYWRRLQERARQERIALVVSPDPAAREVIARYTEDHEIIALQELAQVPGAVEDILPGALIVDQSLVTNDDLQAFLEILPYDLPVLCFALPGSPARPRRLPEDVSDYLVKPIERQSLIDAVKTLGPDVHHLLVVDDDPGMLSFVTRILTKGSGEEKRTLAYRLSTATTGSEALAQIEQDPPQAILLDLALPDMSGWQVIDRIHGSHIPTIMITAHDWPQTIGDGQHTALQVAMRRPLTHHELSPVLKCLLETIQPQYPRLSGLLVPATDPAE